MSTTFFEPTGVSPVSIDAICAALSMRAVSSEKVANVRKYAEQATPGELALLASAAQPLQAFLPFNAWPASLSHAGELLRCLSVFASANPAHCWPRLPSEGVLRRINHKVRNPGVVCDLPTLQYLARKSRLHQEALLSDYSVGAKVAFRELPHARLKGNPRLLTLLPYVSDEAIWAELVSAVEPAPYYRGFSMNGFKVATLKSLAKEFHLSLTSEPSAEQKDRHRGLVEAVTKLVQVFGDRGALTRFMKASQLPWTIEGLHEAGQFQLPLTPLQHKGLWSAFLQRYPVATKYLGQITPSLLPAGPPRTLTELRKALNSLIDMPCPPAWQPLKDLCLELDLSEENFHVNREFWESSPLKPFDKTPFLDVALPEDAWRMRKLAPDDLKGPLLGVITRCCQHLLGTGAETARQGVASPFSAFYVMEYQGQIVGQSWGWVTATGALVFDSIEAPRSTSIPMLASLMALASAQLLAQGVPAVYLGRTTSGRTAEVAQLLGLTVPAKVAPVDPKGYFDGLEQWALAPFAPHRQTG